MEWLNMDWLNTYLYQHLEKGTREIFNWGSQTCFIIFTSISSLIKLYIYLNLSLVLITIPTKLRSLYKNVYIYIYIYIYSLSFVTILRFNIHVFTSNKLEWSGNPRWRFSMWHRKITELTIASLKTKWAWQDTQFI